MQSKSPRFQLGKNPDPFDHVDFGVQIFHFQPEFAEIVRESFRALFRERCNQGASAALRAFPDLFDHIVHLAVQFPNLDRRVKQSGRPNHLFHNMSSGTFQLIGAGGRGNENHIAQQLFKLFKFQRPVVQRRRQAEPVIHQSLFPASVRFVHRLKLRNRHMRFINDHHIILREKVQQAERTGAGKTSAEMA